jgi:hypothetical protein
MHHVFMNDHVQFQERTRYVALDVSTLRAHSPSLRVTTRESKYATIYIYHRRGKVKLLKEEARAVLGLRCREPDAFQNGVDSPYLNDPRVMKRGPALQDGNHQPRCCMRTHLRSTAANTGAFMRSTFGTDRYRRLHTRCTRVYLRRFQAR